eukprot:11224121-Lingulodinium_polyedra.AAC.1
MPPPAAPPPTGLGRAAVGNGRSGLGTTLPPAGPRCNGGAPPAPRAAQRSTRTSSLARARARARACRRA